MRGIAEVSGIPAVVMSRLAGGKQPTVTRRVAAALTQVTVADLTRRDNPAGFVPKVGAVRRIQALQAIGHPAREIAASAGLTEREIYFIVNQKGRWISQARWVAVATAYAELSMTPGCSAKAQAIAAGAGYPPPLAGDDEDLDDPSAAAVGIDEVDEVAVEAVMGWRHPTSLASQSGSRPCVIWRP